MIYSEIKKASQSEEGSFKTLDDGQYLALCPLGSAIFAKGDGLVSNKIIENITFTIIFHWYVWVTDNVKKTKIDTLFYFKIS